MEMQHTSIIDEVHKKDYADIYNLVVNIENIVLVSQILLATGIKHKEVCVGSQPAPY